jgi:hypothetical protein
MTGPTITDKAKPLYDQTKIRDKGIFSEGNNKK